MKFREDSFCNKCDATFYQQCDAFSELMIDRPSKCPNCGAVPYSKRGYASADYYILRGTNLKISADSPWAKIFIQIPSLIIMGVPALLLLIWIADVLIYAMSIAGQHALFLIPRLFGLGVYDLSANIIVLFLLVLILFFIFRVSGHIYNYIRIQKWIKELAELRKVSEGDN